MRVYLIITIAILVTSTYSVAEVYKWRDGNGKLHFSDKPRTTTQEPIYEAPKQSNTTINEEAFSKSLIKSRAEFDKTQAGAFYSLGCVNLNLLAKMSRSSKYDYTGRDYLNYREEFENVTKNAVKNFEKFYGLLNNDNPVVSNDYSVLFARMVNQQSLAEKKLGRFPGPQIKSVKNMREYISLTETALYCKAASKKVMSDAYIEGLSMSIEPLPYVKDLCLRNID